MRAAMVGGAGYVAGKHMSQNRQQDEAQDQPEAPAAQQPAAPVTSEADRVEALTKLKTLLDSGVLTQEQFDAEREKLLQGL